MLKIKPCAKSMQRQAVVDFLLTMPERQFEQMLDSVLFNSSEHPDEIWIYSKSSYYENLSQFMCHSSYPECTHKFAFGMMTDVVKKE